MTIPSEDQDLTPEIDNQDLRKQLFIPELERLLGDPTDFPLANDFDPIRVRMDKAIETIEKRSQKLATAANSKVSLLRLATMFSCFVGFCALFAALMIPAFQLPAFILAAVEIFVVLWLTKLYKRIAVDCIELLRLSDRYRPEYEACKTAQEMRQLAECIGDEMKQMWVIPENISQ